MTYSVAPFVLPGPRLPGGRIWTEVTWFPRDGEAHGTLAAYTAPTAGGHITLIPGVVPTVVSDLGLPALVNRQLRAAPWAEVVCPGGRVTVVLHPRRRR